jgi:hypothetical protein
MKPEPVDPKPRQTIRLSIQGLGKQMQVTEAAA